MFVELLPENAEPGMCGQLIQSLYGTRDAAQNLGFRHSQFTEGLGFLRGVSSSCVFYHPRREIRVVVHLDDF